MTQTSNIYIRAALILFRKPSFKLIQQPKLTFDYWAVRLTICFASFTAASPTLFTLFLTLDLLNLLKEDSPPTGPLSNDGAVNALQSRPVPRSEGWIQTYGPSLYIRGSRLVEGIDASRDACTSHVTSKNSNSRLCLPNRRQYELGSVAIIEARRQNNSIDLLLASHEA